MPNEEKMTIDERYKYLCIKQELYRKAKRKERSQLLDQMQHVIKLNRKTLIRHMKGKIVRKPRQRQRGTTYSHEVDDALRVISESLDYICAERLYPDLVSTALHLVAHGELHAMVGQSATIEPVYFRERLPVGPGGRFRSVIPLVKRQDPYLRSGMPSSDDGAWTDRPLSAAP